MNNYIYEYYQQIQDGTVCVGKWVRLQYENIIKGLENKSFFYDHKKAMKSIKFIEAFTHHHEGTLAPGLLKLELWQKAMLSVIFGVIDSEGNRQFREIFTVVARKNGKTLFAAGIAEYMTYLDDYGARIYFAAPKLDQAALCFDAYFQSILKEPELERITKKRRTDIYVEDNNATAKPLAFNAKKSDGLNITCAICDELASWQGDHGLKFYEVLKSSGGARKQPLYLSISTAGYENDGIFDELMKRSTRMLLGDSKETRLAPFLYVIDEPENWNNINELQKSNPNLGVSVTVDYLLEEIAIAEGSLSKKAEFLTKYCNVKQNSSMAWLNATDIEKCCGAHLDFNDYRNSYAVAGLDLSQTTDLTCATCVIERDGVQNVFAQFFMPAEKIQEATARDGIPYKAYVDRGELKLSGENFVDYHDCFRWYADLIEEYKIYPLMIGYDRYSAQYLVQDLNAYGFRTDDVYQGFNLTPVIRETEGLIRDGKINIGDNQLLKLHLLDTALKADNENNKIKMIKVSSRAHIDGVAAFVDAMTVRQKWYDELGEQLRN